MRGVAVCVVALALLAGCGGSEEAEPSSLAEIVPSDAALYGEFVMRPTGEDGMAIRRFAGALLGTGMAGRDDLAELGVEALELDIDFERDVAPWLGERAAFFLGQARGAGPEGALILETTDSRRATRALRRAFPPEGRLERLPGGSFWHGPDDVIMGVVRGRVVAASSEAVIRESARAAARGSLAETKRYREAIRPMNGRLPAALVVAGREGALEEFMRFAELSARDRRLLSSALDPDKALTLRADVTAADAVIEVLGLRAPGPPAPAIKGLPDAAWLAISSGNLGETLTTGLTAGGPAVALRRLTLTPFPQRMLRGLGRGSVFLQGGAGAYAANGEIVADVRDPWAVELGVKALSRWLRSSRQFTVHVDDIGGGGLQLWAAPMGLNPRGAFDITFRRYEISASFGGTGSAGTLGETRAYRRAERVLGGAPTTLVRWQPFLRAYGFTGDLGAAARLEVLAAQEKQLPGGGLLQRFMIGLNPDAPMGEPPEGQEPASRAPSLPPPSPLVPRALPYPEALPARSAARRPPGPRPPAPAG
jgi:hypothetical protein